MKLVAKNIRRPSFIRPIFRAFVHEKALVQSDESILNQSVHQTPNNHSSQRASNKNVTMMVISPSRHYDTTATISQPFKISIL
jgi:hypothetical protein